MYQYHDGLNALGAQLGNQSIHCGGFVAELQPRHTSRCHDGGSGFECHADEGHLHVIEGFDTVSRQQRFAGAGTDHIGRQPLELGPFKGHGRAHYGAFAAVGVVDAIGLFAAAVLQAQQLSRSFVEFVVADGVEFHTNAVQGFDGGLVKEERRNQRRGPNEVTGAYHRIQWNFGFERGHMGGHELCSTNGRSICSGHRGVRTKGAGRFQGAVVVVESDDLGSEGDGRG